MKQLLILFACLMPTLLFGASASEKQLLDTNNLLRAQHVRTFTNIAEMVALMNTNACVVLGYYLPGDGGGGPFSMFASNGFATNYGTVFKSTQRPTKVLVRNQPDRNVFDLTWFGVKDAYEDGSGETFFDSSNRVQNCINVAPNNSLILWPNMSLVCAPIISNRIHLTFRGVNSPHGARNGISDGPFLIFGGPTNTPALRIYDSAYIRWDGIAIATDSITSTNHASIGIDLDKTPTAAVNSTGFRLNNTFIYSRFANTNWVGFYISRTSGVNVEDTLAHGLTIYGGGGGVNWDDNATNGGIGIVISSSSNAYEERFEDLNFQGCRIGVQQNNGGMRISDVYSYMIPRIYELNGRTAATLIVNDHSELPQQAARIQSGSGSVSFIGCTYNDAPTPTTTNALIFVSGANSGVASVSFEDCMFYAYDWRKILSVSPGVAFRSQLTLRANQYFQATNFGFDEFTMTSQQNDYLNPYYAFRALSAYPNQGTMMKISKTANILQDANSALFEIVRSGAITNNTASFIQNIGLSISNTATSVGNDVIDNIGMRLDVNGADFNYGLLVNAVRGIGINGLPPTAMGIYINSATARQVLMNNSTLGTNSTDGTYLSAATDGRFIIDNQEVGGQLNLFVEDTEVLRLVNGAATVFGSLSASGGFTNTSTTAPISSAAGYASIGAGSGFLSMTQAATGFNLTIMPTNLTAETRIWLEPITSLTNDFVLNAYNTNTSSRAAFVSASLTMTNVAATDVSEAALYLDQDGDGVWEKTGIACRINGSIAAAGSSELAAFVMPWGRFMFTNISAGGGATVTVKANSSQVVRP